MLRRIIREFERENGFGKVLSSTALSLPEIADRTGFTNDSYFSDYFKKQTGLPPGEYRKARQQSEERRVSRQEALAEKGICIKTSFFRRKNSETIPNACAHE